MLLKEFNGVAPHICVYVASAVTASGKENRKSVAHFSLDCKMTDKCSYISVFRGVKYTEIVDPNQTLRMYLETKSKKLSPESPHKASAGPFHWAIL